MQYASGSRSSWTESPPRKSTPSEQTDEALGQIESEQLDVERGIPVDDKQPVEGAEPHERPAPPVFED